MSDKNAGPVLLIFGTRPEAIKMAPLVLKMKGAGLPVSVCVTGQHREMLDQVLGLFNIKPDFDLNLMRGGQSLTEITSAVLTGLEPVLKQVNPSAVLVHGDTTTTLAASLAAFYQQIPVGHVEAGLRTGDIYAPWPEEINRKLTGHIAAWHFAPTSTAARNLEKENINPQAVFVTGNTVIDALQLVVQRLQEQPELTESVVSMLSLAGYQQGENRRLVLITGHRRENFGDGFERITSAIKHLATRFPDVDFVYPVHLNPNVKGPVEHLLGGLQNVYLLPPLSYLPFVYLMQQATVILTDSGGVQEEGPGLGKPVIVMREKTERPEAVDAGTVLLAGTNEDKIIEATARLLTDAAAYEAMSKSINPYGDGKASDRIVAILQEALWKKQAQA